MCVVCAVWAARSLGSYHFLHSSLSAAASFVKPPFVAEYCLSFSSLVASPGSLSLRFWVERLIDLSVGPCRARNGAVWLWPPSLARLPHPSSILWVSARLRLTAGRCVGWVVLPPSTSQAAASLLRITFTQQHLLTIQGRGQAPHLRISAEGRRVTTYARRGRVK